MTHSCPTLIARILLILAVLTLSVTVNAASTDHLPGRWVVELVDPPSLAYSGEVLTAQEAGQSSAKSLPATAPSVTGQPRFDAAAASVERYAVHLDQRRRAVLEQAGARLGRTVEPLHVYRHVANGFSVAMSAAEAAELARLPGVRSVQPVTIHRLHLDQGPGTISANAVWNGLPGLGAARGEGIVVGVIDSGINWDHLAFSDDPEISGHQFTNPIGNQLGLCANAEVSCNNKLIGVYDFTTEGTDGFDSTGHGSHVASIAAGNPLELNFLGTSLTISGVAPRANIVSYKACYDELPNDPDRDGCTSDALIAALEQAVTDGVDVVNYSIGGGAGNPWTQSAGLLNFWAAGIPFVTSAGNDGPGFGTITAPANAPWAFTVGASTHQRWAGNTATVGIGLPSRFILYGSGPALQSPLLSVPIMVADEFGDDRLACTAFPEDALAGSVVLVERGGCAFAVKVGHAADAGALAVLVFNSEPGLPILMAGLEDSTIPSAMMSRTDGLEMAAAVATLFGPRVTMSPNQTVQINPEFADLVANYSSRGPAPGAGNIMKPNVMAPGGQFLDEDSAGAGIIGAGIPDEGSLIFMQGTSMASPHAAGAVALLRQLHQDWTPAMLQSTLETTAAHEPVSFAGAPANQLERGAGRINVARAARAGLFLPVTQADFVAANPATGGDPGSLNLSGIFNLQCPASCTTVRTVEALQAGTWQVSTTGELDITVSPTSFTLQPGQRQALEITYGAEDQSAGGLIEGRIVLTPASSSAVEQTLSVAIAAVINALPDQVVIDAEANRGSKVLEIEAVMELPEAVYNTSALVKPTRHEFSLGQNPDPDDPFEGQEGTRTFLVDVPADTLMLFAETLFSTAPDIDLFVGRDSNGNGQADPEELVCASTTPDELEQCLIMNPEAGTWWVLVQNWQASDAVEDDVELDIAVLARQAGDYSLVASGVGIHSGGPLSLDLSWDQPAMRLGERWLGAVGFSSNPDELADVGVVPVMITRNGPNEPAPTALFNGQSLSVVLPPNSRHEQLFIDLPPTAERLEVLIQGDDGVDAALQSVDFASLAGSAPGTPAPGAGELASGTGSADGIELVFGGGGTPPPPARYYVILDNTSDQERLVEVQANIIEAGRLEPRFGLWSPQSRLIFQGIEWQRAGPGFMIWYSYDNDGLPIFYIATGDINPLTSTWQATLERVTSNNERQTVEVVGEVALTALAGDSMAFAWRLNGAHGSELMNPDAPPTCPEIDDELVSYTGHWFSLAGPVGGTTVIVTDDGQFFVRYYYDHDGVGRWVFVSAPGGADGLGEALEVRDFRGFCPNCPQQPMSFDDNSTAIGVYGVSFDSESTGSEMMDFTLAAPLGHDISLDVPVQKLSERLDCIP